MRTFLSQSFYTNMTGSRGKCFPNFWGHVHREKVHEGQRRARYTCSQCFFCAHSKLYCCITQNTAPTSGLAWKQQFKGNTFMVSNTLWTHQRVNFGLAASMRKRISADATQWGDKWLVNKIANCWVETVHHFESYACPNAGSEPARRNEKWSASAASTHVSVSKVKRRVMLDNFINRDSLISPHCTCRGKGGGHKVRATPWSEIVIGKKEKPVERWPVKSGQTRVWVCVCVCISARKHVSMSALMFPQGLAAK